MTTSENGSQRLPRSISMAVCKAVRLWFWGAKRTTIQFRMRDIKEALSIRLGELFPELEMAKLWRSAMGVIRRMLTVERWLRRVSRGLYVFSVTKVGLLSDEWLDAATPEHLAIIVRTSKKSEAGAFERLLAYLRKDIDHLVFSKRFGYDAETARDLAVEGVWRATLRFDPLKSQDGSFRNYAKFWIAREIKMRLSNELKALKTTKRGDTSFFDACNKRTTHAADLSVDAEELLAALDHDARQVFTYLRDGYTKREVQTMLGLSVGRCDAVMKRGQAQLLALMGA